MSADLVLRGLGVALLHSLWQIAAIAVAACILVALLRRAPASARAAVAGLALLAAPVAFSATAINAIETASAPRAVATIPAAALEPAFSAPSQPVSASPPPAPVLRWTFDPRALALVWLAGASLAFALLAVGLVRAGMLVRHARPAEPRWSRRLDAVAADIGIKAPALLIAPGLTSPCAIGVLRQRIVAPAFMFETLNEAEIDAVFRHELAHVRRRDTLFGLLQAALKCLFFYHPGVLALARIADVEREKACDEAAARDEAQRRLLALGLAKIVVGADEALPTGAFAADHPRSAFMERLQILAGERAPVAAARRLLVAGAGLTVLCALGACAAATARPTEHRAVKTGAAVQPEFAPAAPRAQAEDAPNVYNVARTPVSPEAPSLAGAPHAAEWPAPPEHPEFPAPPAPPAPPEHWTEEEQARFAAEMAAEAERMAADILRDIDVEAIQRNALAAAEAATRDAGRWEAMSRAFEQRAAEFERRAEAFAADAERRAELHARRAEAHDEREAHRRELEAELAQMRAEMAALEREALAREAELRRLESARQH